MQAKASKCKTQASQVVQKTDAVNLTYFSQTTIICRAVSHQTSQEKKKKKIRADLFKMAVCWLFLAC